VTDWKEAKVLQIKPNQKYNESTHVSGRSSSQSTQFGHLPHLDSHYCSRSQKDMALSNVDYVWKLRSYVGTMQKISLFSDDFYSDSTLILIAIAII
jgi:hypothetical protein